MQFLDIISVNIWDILISLINLLILFLVFKHFLFKPVQKMLDQRKQQVEDIYAAADESRTAAEDMKQQYEAHENAFHQNHPNFPEPVSFDEQIKRVRQIRTIEAMQEKKL